MIANALNKLYSDDHLTTQRKTLCSSILKKFHLTNNEKKMLRKDVKFKSEIHIESNTKNKTNNNVKSSTIEKDILITSYLSGTSFKSQYEYKLPITEAVSQGPIHLVNDEKNTSSYHLQHCKNENLQLKQKFSNKLKEFSSSKANEFATLNLLSSNCNNDKNNKDEPNVLVYQNSISSNSNSNLSDDDDECCSNCSITNTMNRLSMFDQQAFNNNLDNAVVENRADMANRLDQSDDITYSVDDVDFNKEKNLANTESKLYEIIELAIHRLPGKKLSQFKLI